MAFLCSIQVAASASDINWVGYQFGPPGGFEGLPFLDASFFHSDNWFNYQVPGSGDAAVFDVSFDPQDNGMPRTVYFGDYEVGTVPIYAPNPQPIPASDAQVGVLRITSGTDWSFNLGPKQGQGTQSGSLTVNGIQIANEPGQSAGLTLAGGEVSVNVGTHIATVGSTASLRLVDLELDLGYLDLGLGGNGTLTLDGGSSLKGSSSFGPIWVGIFEGGQGQLIVNEQSSVFGGGAIGREQGSEGRVTLSDGSSWTMEPDTGIRVGHFGTGILEVRSGSLVEGRASMGVGQQAGGTATVTGTNSRWNVHGLFAVAVAGQANIDVRQGGRLNTEHAVLARHTGSFANVTIRDGGVWEVRANSTEGTVGRLRIGGDGSAQLHARNSRILVESELQIGTWGAVDVRSNGIINIGSGPEPEPGNVRVGPGGTLGGTGAIFGNVIIDGGTLSPGFSPGVLTVHGDLTLLSGGSLVVEVGGAASGQFDQINVTGAFVPNGELIVRFTDGYVPPADLPSLPLIASPAISDTLFTGVRFENIDPTLVPANWNDGSFFMAEIPEPSAVVLLLTALSMIAARRQLHN